MRVEYRRIVGPSQLGEVTKTGEHRTYQLALKAVRKRLRQVNKGGAPIEAAVIYSGPDRVVFTYHWVTTVKATLRQRTETTKQDLVPMRNAVIEGEE